MDGSKGFVIADIPGIIEGGRLKVLVLDLNFYVISNVQKL